MYEYKAIRMYFSAMYSAEDNECIEKCEGTMNQMSADGWILDHITDRTLFIFKRTIAVKKLL